MDGLYDEQHILSSIGLTGNQYRDIMTGNTKMPHSSGIDKLNFERATIKLQNYLTKYKISDSSYKTLFEWKKEDSLDRRNVSRNLPIGIHYDWYTIPQRYAINATEMLTPIPLWLQLPTIF